MENLDSHLNRKRRTWQCPVCEGNCICKKCTENYGHVTAYKKRPSPDPNYNGLKV